MSNTEYVQLVGHYNKLTIEQKIDPRLLAKGYSEEALKQLKSRIGKKQMELISLNLHFKSDMEDWEYEHFDYVMTLFDAYNRHGVLPYEGPLTRQPNKLIEIFQVLENLKVENERKAYEKQQKAQEKSRKKR